MVSEQSVVMYVYLDYLQGNINDRIDGGTFMSGLNTIGA